MNIPDPSLKMQVQQYQETFGHSPAEPVLPSLRDEHGSRVGRESMYMRWSGKSGMGNIQIYGLTLSSALPHDTVFRRASSWVVDRHDSIVCAVLTLEPGFCK
jgi:hypothetical protein